MESKQWFPSRLSRRVPRCSANIGCRSTVRRSKARLQPIACGHRKAFAQDFAEKKSQREARRAILAACPLWVISGQTPVRSDCPLSATAGIPATNQSLTVVKSRSAYTFLQLIGNASSVRPTMPAATATASNKHGLVRLLCRLINRSPIGRCC